MCIRDRLKSPVQYHLPMNEQFLGMNQWIGKHIQFHFNDEIYCLDCGQRTKKSFNQGFCYTCFQNSPMSSECIIKPELCRAHLGEDRDMEWERKHHLKDHYVYLAVSSGLKVGITRDTQVPTRWIDQGASYAVPIARTPNRYLCGMIEVSLKQHLSDRTAWQRMLKNEITHVDLTEKREEVFKLIPKEYHKYLLKKEDGSLDKIILPIHGYGLWSTLYGFIALEKNGNDIFGLQFYQHAETPGLGAEVDNPKWKAQWKGKKLNNDNGELMRHQIGTMVTGIEGTEANECNIQGEFTFDFATRTYTGNNQLGSGFSTVPTVYNVEEKPSIFFTHDGLRRYAR